MDKSFNFFKTKIKKQTQRRNASKSNSSKASYTKQSQKPKQLVKSILSKRQKQIRQAIQLRYHKSKIKIYKFNRKDDHSQRTITSNDSNDMPQFKHLKKTFIVDLKEYHKKQEDLNYSIHSSQEKKFNLKIKLKDNNFIVKTQGNQPQTKNMSSKILKNTITGKIKKNQEQWKFISIQFKDKDKEDSTFKNKIKKPQIKINSHRSYTIQNQKVTGSKLKINGSINKNLDKPKINSGQFGKTRF